MNNVILTQKLIEDCESLERSYSKDTAMALGVSWPLVRGWKLQLIGKSIPTENYQRALEGKSRGFWRHEFEKNQLNLL